MRTSRDFFFITRSGRYRGTTIQGLTAALSHTGACPEADDPYVPAEFASTTTNDSPKSLDDARSNKIGAYHRVPDVDTARACLASGYAIALGFTVYESFEDIRHDGVMPMPQPGEQIVGGHATVIRGYDDKNSKFLIQNSWGEEWGLGGLFWMPYAFVENAEISQPDMWMGHLGKPWK